MRTEMIQGMRRHAGLVWLVALVGVLALAVGTAPAVTATGPVGAQDDFDEAESSLEAAAQGPVGASPEEADLFELINASRARAGMPPLTWDPVVAEVSRAHTLDMLERGYFDHDTPEGWGPPELLRDAGVRFSYWGQTLTRDRSIAQAHEGDLREPPVEMREIILDPSFVLIGLGVQPTPEGFVLITATFIRP